MDLVIRLAGPVQTWARYRATHSTAHTSPLPTKSGVAGLLGACLGVRDYLTLLPRFDLSLRIDRTNPVEQDIQVAVPPAPGRPTTVWHRSVATHQITAAIRAGSTITAYRPAKDINLTGGTNKVQFSPDRTFVPHAEFTCRIRTDDMQLGRRLQEGFRRPRYMPYLGRAANAPSFPFFLGACPDDSGDDILTRLPHVPPEADRRRRDHVPLLRLYRVEGDYDVNRAVLLDTVSPPTAATRTAQLRWAKENLTR